MINLYNKGISATGICKLLPYSSHTVLKYLRQNNVSIRNRASYKNSFNENYFENIDTQEKAYFLGLLMADGWFNDTCSHGKKELRRYSLGFVGNYKMLLSIKNTLNR